ncbi:hypothetical protein J1614_008037 [Plenodomus biglobosus]|nr:hypothetical protein J1614_008037 [Plenodomus biglobosus]
MTGASEQQEGAVAPASPALGSKDPPQAEVNSPARSDKSSDSEGKEVRDKLKETQIDAQATSNPTSGSDHHMNDASNGDAKAADLSASGSDSERGRLRRKRSREDFEDEAEAEKLPGKKPEAGSERHRRKKSRDISKDEMPAIKQAHSTISRIEENDVDEKKDNSAAAASNKVSRTGTSPKNKRTREQLEKDTEAAEKNSEGSADKDKTTTETSDERDSKRLRDQEGARLGNDTVESKTKIPSGSGFANTSAASPFAAMAKATKTSDKAESIPQTSDDKFKSSGFGGFASSTASPFGGLGSTKSSTTSPFGAIGGSKPSPFAGSRSPDTGASGFGALGSSTKPTLGGSTFGSSAGFAGLATMPKGSGLSSFASGPSLEIKGLTKKADKPFGAAATGEASDDEDGDESGSEATSKEERQSSQPLLSQQPHETGEEGESTVWAGRAKLYTMAGEASSRAWQERGSGNFKFNITDEEPRKARFVLRADGTHRLLLNVAVTKKMIFGGNAQGEKPKDTRLLFNSPTPDGELEMHLLKLKSENAVKLWEEVTKVQEREL